MKEVFSSSVSSIGYDPGTRELSVVWSSSNKTSVYSDVSPEEAQETERSWSVGSAVRALAASKPHRYA
jgi:hypothetical protein